MKASKATFLLGIFFLLFLVLDRILALDFFSLSQDIGFLLAGLSALFWAYCLKRRES